jgi:hypothetical protein
MPAGGVHFDAAGRRKVMLLPSMRAKEVTSMETSFRMEGEPAISMSGVATGYLCHNPPIARPK